MTGADDPHRDIDAFTRALGDVPAASPSDGTPFEVLHQRAQRRRRLRHQRAAAGAAAVVLIGSVAFVATRSDDPAPITASTSTPGSTTATTAPSDLVLGLDPDDLPAGWRLVQETHETATPGDFSDHDVDGYVLSAPDGVTVRITVEPGVVADLADVATRLGGSPTTVGADDAVFAADGTTGRLVWNAAGRTATTVEGPPDEDVLQVAAAALRPVTRS